MRCGAATRSSPEAASSARLRGRTTRRKSPCDIADGVRVRVVRSTITSVLAKPDPGATREAARQREDTRVKAETKE